MPALKCRCGQWYTERDVHPHGACRTCRYAPKPKPRRRKTTEPRPAWGSQQWAETRGDDLGESPDD